MYLMSMRRSTRKRLMTWLAVLAVGILVLMFTKERRTRKRMNIRQSYPVNLAMMKKLQKKKVPTEPNVVKSRPSGMLLYEDCVDLPESPVDTAKVCVYPAKFDTRYSEPLKEGRLFEKNFMNEMVRMIRFDHEMQLVDLGANLGQYSLTAAAWGSKVLAADMYPDNIRQLQTSLSVSGLSKYVTLVNNAFWSDHRRRTVEHISRAKLARNHFANIPKPNFNKWGLTADTLGHHTVFTVCLDDLLPLLKLRRVYLRMDLEGDEAEALKCAIKFFDLVDVRVVQMKWQFKTPEDIARITTAMTQEFGFRASRDATRYSPVNVNAPTAVKGYVYWLPADLEGEDDDEEEEDEDEEGEEIIKMDLMGRKHRMIQKVKKKKIPRVKGARKKDRGRDMEKEFREHQEMAKGLKGDKFKRGKRGGIFWHNDMVG